ncbi:MAG: VgrG-related protein [Blastocatellales bacterium]
MSEPGKLIYHFYLEINGQKAPEELMLALLEIAVESSLHMPDMATLVIHDPQLRWLDDSLLKPGRELRVQAITTDSDKSNEPIFNGEIIELEPEFVAATHHLTVRAYDRLHRLMRGRCVRTFQNVTDGDLVRQIADETGLEADPAETRKVHPYVLQCNQSNLEFLRERAASLGYLLYAYGRKLCFKPLVHQEQIQLKWGENLIEFRPRLTTLGQVNTVVARGWNPDARQELSAEISRGDGKREIGEKQSGGEIVKQAFHLESSHLVVEHPVRMQSEVETVAQIAADRMAESFIEAEGICAGHPALTAGVSVAIISVGDQFSGKYFVTSASHSYSAARGYVTRFSVSGQTPASLLSILRKDEPRKALGNSLVIGVITDNNDPRGWGRVKVKYPWLSPDHSSDWMRVVSVGAGPQRGIEFLPEVGDEVLVGFELGDAHHPYVLGGLWNGQDAPPEKSERIVSTGHVRRRIIRSRNGHTIVLDDDDKGGVYLTNQDGDQIKLDGDGIIIADKAGNRCVFDRQGVSITNKNGDKISMLSGKLELNAKGGISIKSAGVVEINGLLLKLNCPA